MVCQIALLVLMNAQQQPVAMTQDYKRPDPVVARGDELCQRKVGTCAKVLYLMSTGHVHVQCEEKKGESSEQK